MPSTVTIHVTTTQHSLLLTFSVKDRIEQAIGLLDDLPLKVRKSGNFFYRSQTYYPNHFNENRSPLILGACNPLFAFNSRTGETSDPFGNISKNVQPFIQTLCLDEGEISKTMFLWRQKKELVMAARKQKEDAEERQKRQMSMSFPKLQLQKTTQTEPTVCTECLIRKLRFRATSSTQTYMPATVDTAAQTNPMQVQTVSEFGSITELTPNQVRAVSELIKYIKMTATSGTTQEMRNSMRNDQMYDLNNDLYAAYQYFDGMVESRNRIEAPQPSIGMAAPVEQHSDATVGTEAFGEDGDSIDEYEEFHKNFCEAEDVSDYSSLSGLKDPCPEDENEIFDENFSEPKSTYPDTFGFNRGQPLSTGQYGRPSGSMTTQPARGKHGGRGRGQQNQRGFRPNANRKRK